MSLVTVYRADDYSPEVMDDIVARHFEALGIAADLKPHMRVLIKPNLLTAKRPEFAVTTNPYLIDAIVRWLQSHNITRLMIADSPGGPYVSASLKNVYSSCGLRTPDCEPFLNYDTSWQSVPSPEGFVCRSFNIITPICEADYIINAAKLKTHSMTAFSAATKNLFGAVPGLQKPEMHYRYAGIYDFCGMITELARVVAPQVSIIDAVDAMEGNGPSGGRVRHTGLTLASRDVFALDLFAANLMGIPPKSAFLRRIADESLAFPKDIELAGCAVTPFSPPFMLPDSMSETLFGNFPSVIRKPLLAAGKKFLRPIPRIDDNKCVGCGKCAESCPSKTIRVENGRAHISRRTCISCFCCQEMCPVGAVIIKRKFNY
ncbi:MAG: DUF362 domain-containing protein [Oscillospiraceae bacterium]